MAGKSIYLRQVALITLMAHLGSFIPANSLLTTIAEISQLSITSKIKTQTAGYCLVTKGGEPSKPVPTAHPVGTTVQVDKLFLTYRLERNFKRLRVVN